VVLLREDHAGIALDHPLVHHRSDDYTGDDNVHDIVGDNNDTLDVAV
jgi:hypothetical protein